MSAILNCRSTLGIASPSPGGRVAHLDVLRGAAVILIVGIHAFGYAGPLTGGEREQTEAVWFSISTMAVPAFFFCD